MKKLLCLALFSVMSLISNAEVLFDGNTAGAWDSSKITAGEGFLTATAGYLPIRAKEFIQVPRGKKYTVSGEFRIVNPVKPVSVYFGVTPYTADGKEIPFVSVFAVSRATATLAKEIKAGDKVMILKDAENWKFHHHCRFAMNAKADRSDLPNLDIAPNPIINEITVNDDNTVEIPFKKAFTKDYPAGTVVRQHMGGNSFIYAGNGNKSNEWMSFSKTFSSFYTGTAQIKVTFNVTGPKVQVELRNVKVTAE